MFTKKYNERMKFIFLGAVLLFIIIFVRILYVQVFSYNKLSTLSDDLWSRELPISASRGKILDRNGKILADNITITSLIIIPNQIKNPKEVAKTLSDILNTPYDDMYKHVTKKASIERVHPEGRNLSYEIADKINSYNFDGVYLVKEAKRNYPNGKMLSHVLGYTGIDNQGLSGIELLYDEYLTGEDGAIKYYSDAKGNKLDMAEVYTEPSSGLDVMLTVDFDIQTSIERELDNIAKAFTPDHALAVAMDPNTGEILGMSSRPNFDPNNYKKYDTETLNRNLPIWMTYEPGSTFKIITTASAVEEGVVNLEKDTFYDSGSVKVSGAKLRCWKPGGHGAQTFLQVFENSCNPGFVKMGFSLGKDKLFKYINLFGFGEKTGIDLNGEGKGILFNLKDVKDLELATTAFGQGVSVTPIQQITAVSSIVNGGNLYRPYIMKSLLDSKTGNIYKEKNKQFVRKTISKNTSNILRMALESVVAKGGGKVTYIDGYRVGGKTGTAQKVENGRYLENNYIMSFMAVLPSNDPKVVLYLAIDNPKKTALLSSYTTTPFVRKILLDMINIMDIKKQPNQKEKDYEWMDKKYYDVPNVIGMTKKEAKKYLSNFEITYVGDGDVVLDQTPKAGVRYYETGTIKLLMGKK
ncbi:MAG: stage V sporulation protein D [bacterium]|nr:stage V sporulation protein D [bacterium]